MILKRVIALFFPLAFFILLPPVLSQTQTTGRIVGTVKDQTGAVIGGAEVSVLSAATGVERIVATDETGNYAVPLLPPGNYQVSISASGFKGAQFEAVQVFITESTTLNVGLHLGELRDAMTITDAAPLLHSAGPQLGRVVNSRAVSELPLATRNFTQILALSPGASVALADNTALGRNSLSISVNGARVTQNSYQINGVDANNLGSHNANALAAPAPETIQEFKVQTSLYDATFGRSGGGNIQIVTKGGSNDWHGAAYEYLRNDAFNANTPTLKSGRGETPSAGAQCLRRNTRRADSPGKSILLCLLSGHARAQRSFDQQPILEYLDRAWPHE